MLPKIWQVDFHHHPLIDTQGNPLWKLVICDRENSFHWITICSQLEANLTWLTQRFQEGIETYGIPDVIQVFRPQCLSLIELVGKEFNIKVVPTRRTSVLKSLLQAEANNYVNLPNYTGQFFDPLQIETPPPIPLPENLWGEKWGFVSILAGELVETFRDRPIPILSMPEDLFPYNLGMGSHLTIPGVMIEGGRRSMQLARWLAETQPFALNYVSGSPDGLILEGGLVDRWIVATFTDTDVAQAAHHYEQRKQLSQGLHFLLVQPDQSGMTYSGFWLLQK